MPALERHPLADTSKADILALMNHPRVGRYLPLLRGPFTEDHLEAFLADKARMWAAHGLGPHAFLLDGRLVGWGGLQVEGEDVDLALVLHPDHWGLGRVLFPMILNEAFREKALPSVTALLPPGRGNRRAQVRLGFREEASVEVGGAMFIRYRLDNPCFQPSASSDPA